ncbi:MAG TPA: 2OG-Fe(II) oxygenase [Terriglobales bacterium]|nr:2OG-Fe(II) oxygenase [Terriglobales bacterium]
MNTSDSIDFLSDVLLDDERIVTSDEREFLAELLRYSENNPHEANPGLTQAIARIAGEVVMRRASVLVGDGILRRLSSQYIESPYKSHKSGPPHPPHPSPPTPGAPHPPHPSPPTPGAPHPPHPSPPTPGPKCATTLLADHSRYMPPHPPQQSPPTPGGTPRMYAVTGPKGILDPNSAGLEVLPPRCVVLEEFLAPAELDSLLAYTSSHQDHFMVSEVITPGIKKTEDFEHRRSHVLMDLGPHQDVILNRLCMTLPHVLSKLGIEPFSISRMEAQITSSKDGDYFRWHSDNGADEVAGRHVTFVYFFHREPKAFEGGELRIQGQPYSAMGDEVCNYYTIIPRQNQVVLFDSSLMHEITPVRCSSGKFIDSRLTVNGWFSR